MSKINITAMSLQKLNIVDAAPDVARELEALGLSVEIVSQIAEAAAAAKAEALPIDPISSPGTLAYIHGVRRIRRLLLPKGWRMARSGNVESTVHDKLGIQLLFQNVDRACSNDNPQAISKKGAGSRSLVQAGLQGELFAKNQPTSLGKLGQKPIVWLVCVSSDKNGVQAEVSCPDLFDGEQFQDFSRRIFVVNDKLDPQVTDKIKPEDSGDSGAEDFEVLIAKK